MFASGRNGLCIFVLCQKGDIEGGYSVKKSNYNTIIEIIVTAIAIILMKTENWQSGAILLLLTVIYDIIKIIKNCWNRNDK